MKLSIVTISFNQAEYLEKALLSVLDQDYDDVEYIVVDAGSSDGSRDIIENYRDRIAKIIFEPDEGPADGLNKGFAQATGDIYGYLNADDGFLPGAFRQVMEMFQSRSEVDVICGDGYIVDRDGTMIRRFRSDPFNTRRYALGGVTVMQQSTFFRRAAFTAVGGFNKDNATSWDGELVFEMSLAGFRFTVAHHYWSIFRVHGDSITGSQRMADISVMNWNRYFERYFGRPIRPSDELMKLWARFEKRLCDPVGLWVRISDKLFGVTPRTPF